MNKPKSGRTCRIVLKDGKVYTAKWIERINKYISCRRWQRTGNGLSKKEKWIDDDKVQEWSEL